MVELLVVIAIVAVAVGLVTVALPDGDAGRLEEEAARLSALLERARTESRVAGVPVRWQPAAPGNGFVDAEGRALHFRFTGLPPRVEMPTRWLDARVSAQVVGAPTLLLGPQAILPAQRVVLSLGDRRVELATDGLGPFSAPDAAPPATAEGARP